MKAYKWNGIGGYDLFLSLSETEMREIAEYYNVDWSFFNSSNTLGSDYFCFVSFSRKTLALLPFLSLAFGGMYDELPVGSEEQSPELNLSEYSLEEFRF